MIRRKQICAGLLALSVGVISANAAFAGRGDEGKGDEDRSSDSIGDPRFQPLSSEPACKTTIMASVGGPTLRDSKTLAIRWMGYSNYELVYGDKIILLDNGYYNRAGTQYKDLGFDAAEVKRADLIIIGHAHADHMSDTAQVGAQTKAPIIAAPITITKLLTQPVNPKQLVSVTGTDGKILKYPHLGITVQPILGLHAPPTPLLRRRRPLRRQPHSRLLAPADRLIPISSRRAHWPTSSPLTTDSAWPTATREVI
jgi:Metallo-beta-lactamase superfamily